MSGAGKQPYAVHAVAFWAIERAYQEAWNSHIPMAQPYQTYAEVGWDGCSHAWAASWPLAALCLSRAGKLPAFLSFTCTAAYCCGMKLCRSCCLPLCTAAALGQRGVWGVRCRAGAAGG